MLNNGQQHSIEKSRQLQRNLYLAAKKDKQRRFHALYDRIFRLDILWRAWKEVRENKGSAGIDGITFEMIEEYGVEEYLLDIQEDLKNKKYRPKPVKRVYIPKPDGKQRPLGIPTIRDRIVQQACKIVIEPIFEANFLDSSYGFRPKRDAKQATEKVKKELYKNWYVVDADIQGYFDNINHEILLGLLNHRISDRRVIKLCRQWLQAGVIENGKYYPTEKGSPQGGVISPLLANIYLHVLDSYWENHKELGVIVRYADDAVIVFAASIPLCMNLDGIVDVYYYLDTAKLNDEPFRQYYEKGEHTLSLVYTFEALKGTIANFSILMKTGYYESASRIRDAQIKGLIQFAQNGGTYEPAEIDQTVPACDIAQRATRAVIFSAGLEPTKVSVWDGTIEIEEKFKGIELDKTNIKIGNFTETVSVKTKEPETSGLSEVFAGIALTDSLIEIVGMKETLESKDTIRTHTISTQYKHRSVYSQEYVNDAEDTFKMRTDYKYISEEQTIDSGRMETISLDFTQYTAESVVIS